MKPINLFLTSCILLITLPLKAQVKIENVNFKVIDYNIIVNYDLSGKGTFSVELYYTSNNGNTWHGPVKSTSGHDWGVIAGKNKVLIYQVLEEHDYLINKSLKFKVKVVPNKGSIIDSRDSIIYKWIRIGKQVWMAENLKATKYTDGTQIPLIKDKELWCNLKYTNDMAYCFYKNKSSFGSQYGILYNRDAATRGKISNSIPSGVQGVCPTGWHIPSNAEWEQLAEFIRIYIGYKVGLHLMSKEGWEYANGSDNLGFSALPGGFRSKEKCNFEALGERAAWWSTKYGGYRVIKSSKNYSDYDFESKNTVFEDYGFSVRCVKD